MSQVVTPPAPSPDPSERPQGGRPAAPPLPSPPPPVAPSSLTALGSRAVRWLARLIGATVWAVVRWVATVAVAAAVVTTAVAAVVVVTRHIAAHGAVAGPTRPITLEPLAARSMVFARDGSVLAELHGEEYRVPIPLDQVPSHVVRAVLDAEDERFFEHGPLDVRSIVRAAVTNVDAGGVSEGGSTITQQLVKVELLTAKQDLNRKLKEAVLAVQFEKQFTKTQILERYLNRVYFGNGAYGVQAAARRYFGVDVQQLTLPQAVLLAGLIRYPGGADPFSDPDAARDRRDVVAERMRFLGHITDDETRQVKAEPLPTKPPPPPPRSSDYFAERVKQELLASEWLGRTPEDRYRALFEGGLSIHTTLDPRAQQAAQGSVDAILPDDPRGFTAALVSIEPATGAVRALVGGPNFDQVKFNLVTDGEGRQVGSAFKMFTLMAAIESGILPHDTIAGSEPCPIDNPGSEVWSPRNVDGQAAGPLTLAAATTSSVNCAYARLIKVVGPQKVVEVARRMGITNPLSAHLSLTLGSEPVTPLQMASAYATLAADGVRRAPYFLERVEAPDGGLRFAHVDQPQRAVSPEHARIVTDILTQTVSQGTGTAAALPGRVVAGKTGSTDENADAWFVGYTPQLSTAVWMGAPQARVSMYGVGRFPRVYGGTYPAMMFGAFMGPALDGQPALGFPGPPPPNREPKALTVPDPPAPDLTRRSRSGRR